MCSLPDLHHYIKQGRGVKPPPLPLYSLYSLSYHDIIKFDSAALPLVLPVRLFRFHRYRRTGASFSCAICRKHPDHRRTNCLCSLHTVPFAVSVKLGGGFCIKPHFYINVKRLFCERSAALSALGQSVHPLYKNRVPTNTIYHKPRILSSTNTNKNTVQNAEFLSSEK